MMHARLAGATRISGVAVLVLALAACGGGSASTSGPSGLAQTVKIGGLFSLTGSFADLGKSGFGGLQVAVKDLNGTDGFAVGGTRYKIELTELDSQSKTDTTTANALQLSRDQGIKFIFGPDESADALVAQAQTFKQSSMYWTSSGSVSDNLKSQGPATAPNGYTWTISASAVAYTTDLVLAVNKALTVKGVAIIATNTKAIDAYVNAATAAYTSAGNPVPADHIYRYDPTTTDFSPILTRIKAYNPDVLYVLGSAGATITAIAKQMVDVGKVAGSLAVLGAGAPVAQHDAVGGPLPYPYFYTAIGNSDFAAPTATHKAFLDRWKGVTGYDVPSAATSQSGAYYAPLKSLVTAMQKAGTVTDVDKIQSAMLTVSVDGPIGSLSFDSAHRAKIALVTCQVKTGQVSCAPGQPNDL